jgi:hypothetical protein
MLMRSGDLWHCTNPACREELSVGHDKEIEVDHVYCACGGIMKKAYISPAFRYLDFLGDRKDRVSDVSPIYIPLHHVRKD